MSTVSIHNGVVTGAETLAGTEPLPVDLPKPGHPVDTNPDELAGQMAGIISSALAELPQPLPMVIVNRLLQARTRHGHKLLWTRFDMLQLYANYTRKLVGK